MKTKLFYLIVLSLIFLGCKDEAKENNSISLEKFVTLEGIDNAVNLNTVDNTVIFSREVDSLATLVGNPFSDYLKKKIIDQPVASKYDLSSVPGHLYKINDDGTFSKVSRRIVIGNAYPKVETVDKVYYNDKLTDKKSLDIAITILKLNIAKNETSELIIKDEVTTKLPDSLINHSVLKTLKEKLSKSSDYEKYYFADGATLSSIAFKKFSEQRFKKKVELSWLTTGGEVYGSKEKFQFRSEVALELIKLKDYIPID